ncbi:MAG: hypothetical protein IT427_08265 [Pirellulales bacterium]|nr:hypothetical protein [Pirellulales bacterium]
MCFSAETSFGSAVLIGGIGVATLPKIRNTCEVLLGSLPLMFAAHQLEEGIVWLGLQGRIPSKLEQEAIWLYILFAQVLLTVIAPWAFWLVEPDPKRRRLLWPLIGLGICLFLFALLQFAVAPTTAEISNHGIEYDGPLRGRTWFAVLYAIVTCGPPLVSSYRWLRVFGVLNIVALIATVLLKSMDFTSVWCAFAAVLSAIIYLHFRQLRANLVGVVGEPAAS